MIISIINHSAGKVSDEELQRVIRAINRQVSEDFEPYWSLGATVRLEGRTGSKPSARIHPVDMRGDGIIYLYDKVTEKGALGFHDKYVSGIPYGFVFTELADELKEPWSVTLSHEVLELIGDPEVNLLVQGPHPAKPRQDVFHWYEMCDAVQTDVYEIEHVQVSNFVLPLYFTGGDERGGRNDFLGRAESGRTLRSFGVRPGGYVGYFNPNDPEDDQFSADDTARRRMATKAQAGRTRRGVRYRSMAERVRGIPARRRNA